MNDIGGWSHHPDCEFWFEHYPQECTCGYTTARPEWSQLEKWTKAQWNDYWLAYKLPPSP